jgi:sporulation protein YlmC with PRC-barrel domain
MKFSELKGRAVVRLDTATKLGEVEDLMMDPTTWHIVSLKVRTGLFSAAVLVPAGEVQNIGTDAVTLAGPLPAAPDAPDPPPPGSLGSSESAAPLVDLTSILGIKVVTDAGTLVGELRDILLDWSNLTITGYEVREGGMLGKAREFVATPEVRFGEKIITMPAALLSQPS